MRGILSATILNAMTGRSTVQNTPSSTPRATVGPDLPVPPGIAAIRR
jgi:hypothetical protein